MSIKLQTPVWRCSDIQTRGDVIISGHEISIEAFSSVAAREDTGLSMLFKVKKEMTIPEFHGIVVNRPRRAEEMEIYSVEKNAKQSLQKV